MYSRKKLERRRQCDDIYTSIVHCTSRAQFHVWTLASMHYFQDRRLYITKTRDQTMQLCACIFIRSTFGSQVCDCFRSCQTDTDAIRSDLNEMFRLADWQLYTDLGRIQVISKLRRCWSYRVHVTYILTRLRKTDVLTRGSS